MPLCLWAAQTRAAEIVMLCDDSSTDVDIALYGRVARVPLFAGGEPSKKPIGWWEV